jgi:hypothetical protein
VSGRCTGLFGGDEVALCIIKDLSAVR